LRDAMRYVANIFILVILYDLFLLRANFVIKSSEF
jgi:hypothetical protein